MRLSAAEIKVTDLFILVVLNLLFFEGPIQDATGFGYIDELTMVAFVFLAVASGKLKRLLREDRSVLLVLLLVCAVGLYGNLAYGIQKSDNAVAADMVTFLKFPLTLLSCYAVFGRGSSLSGLMLLEAKIIVAVLAALALANLAFDFGMRAEGRYAIIGFRGFWSHPTYLVFACVGLIALLTTDFKSNRLWIALALLVVASALRSKGFVLIGVYAAMLVLVGKGRVKINPLAVLCIMGLAVLIGWDAFSIYYLNAGDGWARNELQSASLQVAMDYAPSGSGFATFATNASGTSYSALYYVYGLSDVYGLTPTNYSYMSDTFWPAVIAQFGFVGLALYALMVVFVYKGIRRRASGKYSFIAALLPLVYMLISSTAESAFFNPYSVYMAFCIALPLTFLVPASVSMGSDSCNEQMSGIK